jgi:hypothetical protein
MDNGKWIIFAIANCLQVRRSISRVKDFGPQLIHFGSIGIVERFNAGCNNILNPDGLEL